MKLTMTAALLCLLVPLACCHAEGAAGVMVDGNGTWYRADKELTKADFGTTVAVKAGSLVGLSLAENMTTGYLWHCNWTPESGVVLLRNAAVGPAQMIPGAGGSRHYLFLVTKPGAVKLQPQYGRWWKGGERNPVQTITLRITK